jgi:hypothetical protein
VESNYTFDDWIVNEKLEVHFPLPLFFVHFPQVSMVDDRHRYDDLNFE